MADEWYTFGPVPVYDSRPGAGDLVVQNATGGKLVLVKDGAALPIRDLNGTPITQITSNADGQTITFQAQTLFGLVQFGDIVNPTWAIEVGGKLASQDQVVAAANTAVTTAQQAVQDAQAALAAAGSGGGAGGVTVHGQLSGLTADDHTQYLNTTRGDARYFTQAQTTTAINTANTNASNVDRNRANHFGTQVSSTISDFTSSVQAVPGFGGGGTTSIVDGSVTVAKLAAGIYPTGTTAARQMPYRNDSNVLTWTAANSVVAAALGWVIITDPAYGAADPTGVNKTATKTAITNAVAAVPIGGTLYAPAGTFAWDGAIDIKTIGISVTGPSATWAGAFDFGDNSGAGGVSLARLQMGATVHQTSFRKDLDKTIAGQTVKGYADGSYFIGLDRVRDVQIIDVNFYGAAWPVWVKPNPSCAEHDLSAINVYDCIFDECDIAFYAQFDPTAPGSWLCFADSNFERNTINKSYQYAYYAQGLDGGQVRGNTSFMLNYESNGNPRFGEKMNNFRWDYAAWLHFNDNACFEAGRESVLIDHARYVSVCGNHFAWPGQVVASDAARIVSNSGGAYATDEYAQIAFTGNLGSYYSKSLLSVVGDVGTIATAGNACLFNRSADRFVGTSGQFTGTATQIQTARRVYLDGFAHYRFDLSAVTNLTASQMSIAEVALVRNETKGDGTTSYVHLDRMPGHAVSTSITSFAPYSGDSGAFIPTLTFAAGVAQSVAQCRGMADNFSTYSGMVIVTARSVSGTNKESSYILHVMKTKEATNNLFVMQISGLGYTAGAAADDPSFTFQLESNGLRATPVSQTAGAFLFSFKSSGNLIVG